MMAFAEAVLFVKGSFSSSDSRSKAILDLVHSTYRCLWTVIAQFVVKVKDR
jgi:hypothetical protein